MIAAIAAAAVLARLASPLPAAPGLVEPFFDSATLEGVYRLTLASDGSVENCGPLIRTASPMLNQRLCSLLGQARFEPARNAAGAPSIGVLNIPVRWTGPGGQLTSFIAQDVDLTVAAMPAGAPVHPIAELALNVDAAGRVEDCALARSSGSPALDAVSCKSGPAAAGVRPARDHSGQAVASAQSLSVGFGAYDPVVFKKDRQSAGFGDSGPYYPEGASRLGVSGYAVLACQAGADGALEGCAVAEEFPSGESFGLAALKCAKTGWMKAAPGVRGPVRVRVDFPVTEMFRKVFSRMGAR